MKIRSKRSGPLVIADARLRLAPGEVVEIETPSRQLEDALTRDLVERVDDETPVGVAGRIGPPSVDLPTDYERLSASEAIEYIEDEEDQAKLNRILQAEKRKTVLDALRTKLEEVTAGADQ